MQQSTSRTGNYERALIEPVEPRVLLSGASLLTDINQDTADSIPSQFTEFNGDTLFFTNSPIRQLWKTDGTAGGTMLVKQLSQQADTLLFPRLMPALSDVTLFFAPDVEHGNELWRTDGTPEGTYLLKDINPGAVSSPRPPNFAAAQPPDNALVINDVLYFQATDGVHGLELWRSDGTVDGTYQVKDVWTGAQGSGISRQAVANGILYFSASAIDQLSSTPRLFRSDGTAAGTYAVSSSILGPRDMTAVGDDLFFFGLTGPSQSVLYKTDGVAAPVALSGTLTSVGGGSSDPLSTVAAVGSTFFFTASDGTNGVELWKSDGTPGGAQMVKNISAGSGSSSPRGMVSSGGLLYFTADDGAIGRELYASDGTNAGTNLVEDIRPGSASSFALNPRLVALDGAVYFPANDGASGSELWRSTGTAATTSIVRNVLSGADTFATNDLRIADGALYFSGNDLEHGFEPWRSDGTSAGTAMLQDLNTMRNLGSSPSALVTIGNVTYFAASRGRTGSELWRTDGTAAGTYLVKDINPGSAGSNPAGFVEMGGFVYFTATDAAHGAEIWRTDGTEAGTILVKDVVAGPTNTTFGPLVPIGTSLFFSASGDLWKTDGTSPGTVVVKDLTPVGSTAFIYDPIAYNGKLYFGYGWGDQELWTSDGTDAGTAAVKPVGGPTGVDGFAVVENILYFTGTTAAHGTELWKTDGTGPGTQLVKDIHTSGSSNAGGVVGYNGLAYFWADTPGFGYELWSTDGSSATTTRVTDIDAGAINNVGQRMMVGGDLLYFGFTDSTHLAELWQSDGTAAGTKIVKELNPGNVSSIVSPPRMAYANGLLYFAGIGPTGGVELYQTDGTEDGTILAAQIAAREGSSQPAELVALNGTLAFAANNSVHGIELWTIPLTEPAGLSSAVGSAYALVDGALMITGGTVTLTADAAASLNPDLDVTVATGAAVAFQTDQHLASLRLTGAGASATLAAGGDKVLATDHLSIAAGAVLNLADNDLLIDYPGDSPYLAIRDYVLDSRITTLATGDTTLAIVDNAIWGQTDFGDEPIDETTIVGKYTFFGDADLDGVVTSDDYVAVDVNLGVAPGTRQWIHGDFDGDGSVTSDDYVAIDVNLGKGSPAPAAEAEDPETLIVTVEQAAHSNSDAKPKKRAAAALTTRMGASRR